MDEILTWKYLSGKRQDNFASYSPKKHNKGKRMWVDNELRLRDLNEAVD